jgi:hypothetical protein
VRQAVLLVGHPCQLHMGGCNCQPAMPCAELWGQQLHLVGGGLRCLCHTLIDRVLLRVNDRGPLVGWDGCLGAHAVGCQQRLSTQWGWVVVAASRV